MTEQEYEILDELYFIISFKELLKKTKKQELELKHILYDLICKGWVRCLKNDEDIEGDELFIFDSEYLHYNYVISKRGLLLHNSR